MDSQGLQEFLSASVRCTLTIAELLKVRPQMWRELGQCLQKMGIKSPIKTIEREIEDWEQPRKMLNQFLSIKWANTVKERMETRHYL